MSVFVCRVLTSLFVCFYGSVQALGLYLDSEDGVKLEYGGWSAEQHFRYRTLYQQYQCGGITHNTHIARQTWLDRLQLEFPQHPMQVCQH